MRSGRHLRGQNRSRWSSPSTISWRQRQQLLDSRNKRIPARQLCTAGRAATLSSPGSEKVGASATLFFSSARSAALPARGENENMALTGCFWPRPRFAVLLQSVGADLAVTSASPSSGPVCLPAGERWRTPAQGRQAHAAGSRAR